MKAFLLTRQAIDTDQGIQLVFWFSSHGGPKKVIIKQQNALLFIHQNQTSDAQVLLVQYSATQIKPLELRSFDGELMAGVYCPSQKQFYRVREILEKNAIACYESDIRVTDRFLTERFLTGPVEIETLDANRAIFNPKISPTEYQPSLSVMSFDIETDYQTKQLFSIAYVTDKKKQVIMIGETSEQDSLPDYIKFVKDEAQLLNQFLAVVEEIDPDIFIGWNVINFDFRFLQQKADDLRIPFSIGRQRSKAIWRKQQNENDRYFLLIPGRVVLDGIDTLKSATYAFSNFSLDNVGHELLGRGKLIHSGQQNDPLYKAKEIRRQFYEDKLSLAKYNLEDCQLVMDIFEHANLLNFAIERARLTGLEMDRVGGSVAAFDNLYLPRLHRKGFIAPNIGDYEGRLSAPGGYVMDSIPGMHDSVLVLDYKSLYPSIIRSFKVDPYARIMALEQNIDDTIPGYDGARFSKTDYILPDIIENLWAARDRAKKENNQALSQAIKIIMNSFYGVLGTPGCRIHDSRLTSSITKRSHDIILKTIELIESEGYSVIYGDTDSVFVALGKKCSNQQAQVIGSQLVQQINLHWQESLRQDYGINSFLEMEFETHFVQFFMPTIRGSEKGSKKRYAGMIENDNGQRHLVFKGLETVRTDWTALAKMFQRELYEKVFNEEPYKHYIREIVSKLKDGEYDVDLVYRKRLRQKLGDYQKNIPPHAQAAIKAETYFSTNKLPSRYGNANWIEYVMTRNGPETLECQTAALDYEHYIEKQLTPIADAILSAMGGSMESIIQDQYELF